jgi:Zn finger protein HypA/HybF involved in hydrogenase expression
MDETASRFDAKQHEQAVTGVEVTCGNGHVWSEPVDRYRQHACTHGYEVNDHGDRVAVQTNLECPECGAGYSVVGSVGLRTCPRCGATMLCPRCLAERVEEQPKDVRCPFCGGAPVNVQVSPKVRIMGAVTKVVG